MLITDHSDPQSSANDGRRLAKDTEHRTASGDTVDLGGSGVCYTFDDRRPTTRSGRCRTNAGLWAGGSS